MNSLIADPDGRVDLALAVAIWIVAAAVYAAAAQLPPPASSRNALCARRYGRGRSPKQCQ